MFLAKLKPQFNLCVQHSTAVCTNQWTPSVSKEINASSRAIAFHCTSRMLIIPHLFHLLYIFSISEFYCVHFWVNVAEARQFRTISFVYSGTGGDIWGHHKILRPWGEDIAVQTSARRLHVLQLQLTERLRAPLLARHLVFPQCTYYCLRGCDALDRNLPTFRRNLLPASSGVYRCRRFISDHTASHTTKNYFIICMLWRQYSNKFIIRVHLNGIQRRWKGSIGIRNYKGRFTLAMPCPCHALTMSFFSRPRHSTAVERRPVGYLPAFGFFRLPRGVPRRLLSEAYHAEFHEDCYQKHTTPPHNDPYLRL
jgi:hypothetical protein